MGPWGGSQNEEPVPVEQDTQPDEQSSPATTASASERRGFFNAAKRILKMTSHIRPINRIDGKIYFQYGMDKMTIDEAAEIVLDADDEMIMTHPRYYRLVARKLDTELRRRKQMILEAAATDETLDRVFAMIEE